MRLEQLEYLLALSQSDSINMASDKLHISHQCLNKSLKSLESELGTKLFERTSKGITLTTVGKKAVETSQDILEQIQMLKAVIAGHEQYYNADLGKGSMSIVTSPLTSNTIMVPVVKQLKKQYPQLTLMINEISPQQVLEAVHTNRYDLGITNMRDLPPAHAASRQGLHFEVLYCDQTVLLVSKYSSLAHKQKIAIKEMLKLPLLLYGPSMEEGNYIAQIMQCYGSTQNFSYTNNFQIYNDSIANGLYYTISTQSIYQSMEPVWQSQMVPIKLKEPLKVYITLSYPIDRPLSSIAEKTVDLIKAYYG